MLIQNANHNKATTLTTTTTTTATERSIVSCNFEQDNKSSRNKLSFLFVSVERNPIVAYRFWHFVELLRTERETHESLSKRTRSAFISFYFTTDSVSFGVSCKETEKRRRFQKTIANKLEFFPTQIAHNCQQQQRFLERDHPILQYSQKEKLSEI